MLILMVFMQTQLENELHITCIPTLFSHSENYNTQCFL